MVTVCAPVHCEISLALAEKINTLYSLCKPAHMFNPKIDPAIQLGHHDEN